MKDVAVVGWFVSIILKELLDRIKSQLSESEKIVELKNALTKIMPITDEVERRVLSGDASLEDYFNQIRENVYDAQDVLGEHIYLADQQKHLNRFAQKAKYPCNWIIKFLNLDKHHRKMTRVINNLETISAPEVKATLDIAGSGSSRHVLEDAYFQPKNCTSPTLTIPASEFRGRSADVDLLVDDLTDPTCSDVVAIVGECGIGKTTLAQSVCGDPKIVEHFTNEGIVWVWAAPMGDKLKIAKHILKVLVSDRPLELADQDNFGQLKKMLEKELKTRRILLVLDDVGINSTTNTCAKSFDLWNEVLNPIKGANSGSRVLITTQWKNVAKVMKVKKPILLEGLPVKECLALFEKVAFQGRGADSYPELGAKGKKIIAKINGSPRLTKAAGEKLEGNTSRHSWDEILNDEKELYEGIVSELKSRFKYLPEHLKRCFAFCSIFPKNWNFNRDSLVKMWISQAFIAAEENKAVDVGREYFNELESWSFFQKINDGTQYTIPHPMHYLAQSVSFYDCARIEGDKQENVPDTVRHLSVTTNNLPQLKKLGSQLKKLRTLLVIRNPEPPSNSNSNPPPAIIEKEVFSKLKRLRLLDISGCDMTELPQSILEFMHLRYLALCVTLTSLPEQMEKLLLKVLVIPKKCILKELPGSLAKIHTMEHLDMDKEYFSFAPGIGEMTRLQSSVTFHVKKSKEGTNLKELKDLDNLCKELIIRNLESVTDEEGASQAQLCKKKHLEVLQLEWNGDTKSAANVLNALQPPKELKTLHISGYAGPLPLPEWFNDQVRNLKYLYLTSCTRWEELPPLGNLPYLAILHLTRMPSLQQITHSFYGNVDEPFKYLKKLIFEEMLNLKSWASPSTNKKKFLPCLQKLRILNCPNLETVPVVPETVTTLTIKLTKFVRELNLSVLFPSVNKEPGFNLDITNVNIVGEPYLSRKHLQCTWNLSIRNLKHATTEDYKIFVSLKTLRISESDITDELLTNCLEHLKHLSKLEINSCGNIKSLSIPKQVTPGDIQLKHLKMLSSLASLENNVRIRSLTIQNCPILTAESFPTHFESLASLKNLWISDCPKLKSLPASFPSTLEHIQLAACDPALSSNLKDDWFREGEVSFVKITKSCHPLLRKELKGMEHMVKIQPAEEATNHETVATSK